MLKKINFIVIIFFLAELIFGGGGGIFVVGPLKLRIVLFITIILLGIYQWTYTKLSLEVLIIQLYPILILLMSLFIGIINTDSIPRTLIDFKSLVSVVIFIPLFVVNENIEVKNIIKIFKKLIFYLSIFYTLLLIVVKFDIIDFYIVHN